MMIVKIEKFFDKIDRIINQKGFEKIWLDVDKNKIRLRVRKKINNITFIYERKLVFPFEAYGCDSYNDYIELKITDKKEREWRRIVNKWQQVIFSELEKWLTIKRTRIEKLLTKC